jgi:type IV secretion system protein VirB8
MREEYDRKNPDSPINLYGKTDAVRLQILSTTIIGSGRGRNTGTATVRFQRSLFNKPSGKVKFLDNKLATLTFRYNDNLRLDDEQRVINPLGFQVVSYKVDNDYVASPRSVPVDTTGTESAGGAPATPPAGAQVPVAGAASSAPLADGDSSPGGNGEGQK